VKRVFKSFDGWKNPFACYNDFEKSMASVGSGPVRWGRNGGGHGRGCKFSAKEAREGGVIRVDCDLLLFFVTGGGVGRKGGGGGPGGGG